MATRQRVKETGRGNTTTEAKRARSVAARRKDINQKRREKYSADADYRRAAKLRSLETYRRSNPKETSRIAKGLRLAPTLRELQIIGDEGQRRTDKSYSLSEAASALGKNYTTLRRWVEQGLIPPPMYKDCVRGYSQYTEKEVKAVGKVLRKHERAYDYLHHSHTDTIENIWQEVENARG